MALGLERKEVGVLTAGSRVCVQVAHDFLANSELGIHTPIDIDYDL